MGKHAYRLAKEEIGLITRSRSVKYKGVTLSLINLPFQIDADNLISNNLLRLDVLTRIAISPMSKVIASTPVSIDIRYSFWWEYSSLLANRASKSSKDPLNVSGS